MPPLNEISGYEVLDTLGHGARSAIYAVRDKKNQVYALKRVQRKVEADQRFIDQAIGEHKIARQFDHPALRKSIKLTRVGWPFKVTEVQVLMELVDGKTLEEHHPTRMTELCDIFKRVAEGLAVMHDMGYVHADIKPKNILLTGGNAIKIIDFGQSCPIGTVKERIQGTPDYIAPEQVRRREITPSTDIFNLGASMYWLLTDRYVPTVLPSKAKKDSSELDMPAVGLKVNEQDMELSKRDCPPPVELNDHVPPALSSLIMECVQRRPSKRPSTIKEVIDRIDLAIGQSERNGGGEVVAAGVTPRRNAS